MMTVVIPTYGPGIADPALIWQYEILRPIVCELIVAWDKPPPSPPRPTPRRALTTWSPSSEHR